MDADAASDEDDSSDEAEAEGADEEMPGSADALPGYQDPELEQNPNLLHPGDLAPVKAAEPIVIA